MPPSSRCAELTRSLDALMETHRVHPYSRANRPTPVGVTRQSDSLVEVGITYKGWKMEPPTSSLSQANIEYQLRNIQRYNPDVQFVDPEHFEIAIDPTTWTEFETKERRRIIEFTAVFDFKPTFIPQVIVHWRPIDPSQYQSSRPNSHSISVILDEGRAVLTSVDIISSAETFFATRFCTGEKNRIRRGFESSGPNTLHKGGSELYSCIQGFNNPKPRNIDKSVKVFPAVVFRSLIEKICSNYIVTVDTRCRSSPVTYYTNPQHWNTDLISMEERRRFAHKFLTAAEEARLLSKAPTMPLNGHMGGRYYSSVIPDNGADRNSNFYADQGFSNSLPSLGQLPHTANSSRPSDLARSSETNPFYSHSSSSTSTSNSAFPSHHTGLTIEGSSSDDFAFRTTERYSNGSSSSYNTVSNSRLYSTETDEGAMSSGPRLAHNTFLVDHPRGKGSTTMFEGALSATSSHSNNTGMEGPVPRSINGYSQSQQPHQPHQLNGFRSPSYHTQLPSAPSPYLGFFNPHQGHSESPEYRSSLYSITNELPTPSAFLSSSSFPYPGRP